MKDIYKEKDFVQYVGKLNSEYDRSKDIFALIDEISRYDNFWSVKLTIIEPFEEVECFIDLIRPIFTKEEYLENLEFVKSEKENLIIYRLGDLVVSRSTVKIPQKKQFIDLGFCLGDLSLLTTDELVKEYVKEDLSFDFEKFYNDFPNLNNWNDLKDEYCKYYNFDIKKIMGEN